MGVIGQDAAISRGLITVPAGVGNIPRERQVKQKTLGQIDGGIRFAGVEGIDTRRSIMFDYRYRVMYGRGNRVLGTADREDQAHESGHSNEV
jgi:hypothetical protein